MSEIVILTDSNNILNIYGNFSCATFLQRTVSEQDKLVLGHFIPKKVLFLYWVWFLNSFYNFSLTKKVYVSIEERSNTWRPNAFMTSCKRKNVLFEQNKPIQLYICMYIPQLICDFGSIIYNSFSRLKYSLEKIPNLIWIKYVHIYKLKFPVLLKK